MSFWDVIASAAVALNSLPMPSDVHDVYPFASKAYGTIGTCSAQGFLIWMGTFFVLSSNCALNVYYVCALRYGIAEWTIKKYILPFMLVIAMTVSITVPIAALGINNIGESENINPHPLANMCLVAVEYPIGCTYDAETNETFHEESNSSGSGSESNTIKCIRGGAPYQEPWNILRSVGFAFIGVTFVILLLSLFMVVVTVFDAELSVWRIRRIGNNRRREGHADINININSNDRERHFRRTKAILFQALLYIGAFVLTWVWLIFGVISSRKGTQYEDVSLAVLSAFFMPLQGFFNAMIFTYQKARTLRQVEGHLTRFEAWKQVISKPSSVPETLISRVEIVDDDVRERRQGEYRNVAGSPLRRAGRLSSNMNINDILNINDVMDDDSVASDMNLNIEMAPFDSEN